VSTINSACDILDEIGEGDLVAILAMLSTASQDERRVIFYVTRRLMGKGRKTYGPLHADSDDRDFGHEQSTEAIDALIYWASDVIKNRYRPELDNFDDEPTQERPLPSKEAE
jgi:hypothetical protein